ncbi:hypothetical protein QTI51_18710 [Variovorax sp. J22G73]|jgi:hypothetical protein|uniref:hypothetical protein n=1 Tax=unclassified Variovorax TaxID=663243 RepID=UPI000D5FA8C8|nr:MULTISPECIES: hypothetical protein [unclassified Variovorax]MDM0006926.1 hypothetical protein [Variovorax sp. J22R203]MDM0099322.1 hypothetical protein [Variovorax sp. J22G73]
MTRDQLTQAKDKDLAASLIAIRRAAKAAREAAVRTDTAIVVQRDQKLVRVTAEELRRAGVK